MKKIRNKTKRNKKIITVFLIIIFGIIFFLPNNIEAARDQDAIDEWGLSAQCEGLNCNMCHIFEMVQNLFTTAFKWSFWICLILITIGGVWMIVFGYKDGVKKGKEIIEKAIVGELLVLGSWLIVNTIIYVLAPGTVIVDGIEINIKKTWWQLDCDNQIIKDTFVVMNNNGEDRYYVKDNGDVVAGGKNYALDDAQTTTTLATGDVIYTYADGTKITVKPDGTRIVRKPNEDPVELTKGDEALEKLKKAGVNIKDGVEADGIRLKTMEEIINLHERVGDDLYVTSIVEGQHSENSCHYVGKCVDYRLTEGFNDYICKECTKNGKGNIDNGFYYVGYREGTYAGPVFYDKKTGYLYVKEGNHWHVEYDRKCSDFAKYADACSKINGGASGGW